MVPELYNWIAIVAQGIGSSLRKRSAEILIKVSSSSNRKNKKRIEKVISVVGLTKKERPSKEQITRNSSSFFTKKNRPFESTISKSNSSLSTKKSHVSDNVTRRSSGSLPKKKKLSAKETAVKSSSHSAKKRKSSIENTVSKGSSHISNKKNVSTEQVVSPSPSSNSRMCRYKSRTEKRTNQILDCQKILSRVRERILGIDDFKNFNSAFNRHQAASDSTVTEKGPASEGITRISTTKKSPVRNGDQVISVSTTRRTNLTPTGMISISTTKKADGSYEQKVTAGMSASRLVNSDDTLTETEMALFGNADADLEHPKLSYKSSSFIETEISMHPMRSCSTFPVGIRSPLGVRSPQSCRNPKSYKSPENPRSLASIESPTRLGSSIRSVEIISPVDIRSTKRKHTHICIEDSITRRNRKKEGATLLPPKRSLPTNKTSKLLRTNVSPETDQPSNYVTPIGSPERMLRSHSAPIRKQSPYREQKSHQKLSRPQSTGSQKTSKSYDERKNRSPIRSPQTSRHKTKDFLPQRGLPKTRLRTSLTKEETGKISTKASTTSKVSRISRIETLATPKRCASNSGLISNVTAKRIAYKREGAQEERRQAAEELQRIYQEQEDKSEKSDKPLGLSHNNRVAIRSYVKSQQLAEENYNSDNKIEKPKNKINTRKTYSSNVGGKVRALTQSRSSRRFTNFSNLFNASPETKNNNNENMKANVTAKKTPQRTNNETSSKFKFKTTDQRNKALKKIPHKLSRLNSVPNTNESHPNKKKILIICDSGQSTEDSKNKRSTYSISKSKSIKGLNESIKSSHWRRSDCPSQSILMGEREHNTAYQAPRRTSLVLAKSSSIQSRFSPISEASTKVESKSMTPKSSKQNLLNDSKDSRKPSVWLENDDMKKSSSHSDREGDTDAHKKITSRQRALDNIYRRPSRTTRVLNRIPHRRQTHPLPEIYDELPAVKTYLTPEEIFKISMRVNTKENRNFTSTQRLSYALEERLHRLEAARRRFQSQSIWAQNSLSRLNKKNSMIYRRRLNPLSFSPSTIPIKKTRIIPESELSTVTPPSSGTKAKQNKFSGKKYTAVTSAPVGRKKTKSATVNVKRQSPVRNLEDNRHIISATQSERKRLTTPAQTEESKRRKCLVSKIIMNRACSATVPLSTNNKTVSVTAVTRRSTATQPELVIEVAGTKEEKSSYNPDKTDQATFASSEHESIKRTWDLQEMCDECAKKTKDTTDNKIPYESKSQPVKATQENKTNSQDIEKTKQENFKLTYDYSKKQYFKTMVTTRYTHGISRKLAKPILYEEPQHLKTTWYAEDMSHDFEKSMGEEETFEEVEVEDERDLEKKVSDGLSLDLDSAAPLSRVPIIPDSVSDFMNFLDYDSLTMKKIESHQSVPETDWRLIAALAKKREIDEDRERMADAFHKMWIKDREQNETIATEQKEEYEQYLREKRADERLWHEQNRLRHVLQQQQRREQVLNAIKNKRDKAFNTLTKHFGARAEAIIEKAIEEDARIQLATDKRSQLDLIETYRLHVDLQAKERRLQDASRRRSDALKNVSKRLAINGALNNWTTSLLRQDILVEEATRRARSLARVARTDERSGRLKRAREQRVQAARRMAQFTQRLREAVRNGEL